MLAPVFKVPLPFHLSKSSRAEIQIVPFIAVQVALAPKDMPSGNAIAIFFNSLGGAIAISIAQNIFSNGLRKYIPIDAPGVDAQQILNLGPSYLRLALSPSVLIGVLQAYMKALNQAYVIPIAVGGIATCCACKS